jgi:hypothetical protein
VLVAAASIGVLAACYVGTAAAWVILLEVMGFLAVGAVAGMACPSVDELSGSHDKTAPSERDSG